MTPEEERYRWLRDGASKNSGYCGSAPYVICPRKSVLYAMHKLHSDELDLQIDYDIFDNKSHELHLSNEVVERGLLPEGVSASNFDLEYLNILSDLTFKELGWTEERINAVKQLFED